MVNLQGWDLASQKSLTNEVIPKEKLCSAICLIGQYQFGIEELKSLVKINLCLASRFTLCVRTILIKCGIEKCTEEKESYRRKEAFTGRVKCSIAAKRCHLILKQSVSFYLKSL